MSSEMTWGNKLQETTIKEILDKLEHKRIIKLEIDKHKGVARRMLDGRKRIDFDIPENVHKSEQF